MDKDFDLINARAHAQKQKDNHDDFNNELAGRDTGRMKRFGFEDKHTQIEAEKKRKRSLEEALLNASYAKLYHATMHQLQSTETAVYDALLKSAERVNEAQTDLQNTLDQANRTADGDAIFRAQNGEVYNQDGEQIELSELANITWNDNAPSWEVYTEKRETFQNEQERLALLHHHEQILIDFRTEMEDQNSPPSEERLQEINQVFEDIENDIGVTNQKTADLKVNETPKAKLPELGL